MTIRSSLPRAVSVTPTVTPSRSTVARSHSAATSAMRCEMKMTALPRSRQLPDDREHPLGQIRRQRAVISSSSRMSGSRRARARGRSAAGSDRAGRARRRLKSSPSTPSSSSQPRTALKLHAGEPQVLGDRQVGHQRGVLVDRDDAARRASAGERNAAASPRSAIVAAVGREDPGDDLHQRALAGAVGAHQRMHLAARTLSVGRPQRDDRVESLGDVAGFEKEGRARSCGPAPGSGNARTTESRRFRMPP